MLTETEQMTSAQEQHLATIKMRLASLTDAKYRRGALEHGGNIWDLEIIDLIDSAIDEAIDQATYLLTLRDKISLLLRR